VNIVVFIKWVPAPDGTPELGPDYRLARAGVEGALDPGDEFGVEAALRLAEAHGGEVVAISMGPDDALPAVQRALAMGAHRGVLVTDDALGGADALGTARVLAAAAGREHPDLVIAAVESTDGYTGTVPVTVAELMDLPAVSFVTTLEVTGENVRAERQTPTGYEVVACTLPAVVTLTAGANEPRYPSLKGIMAAKSKPLDRPTVADLGLDAASLAPAQAVVGVEPAPAKAGGEIVSAGDDALARVLDLLTEAKVI
jgi:electron transfer flavoprotein beta subunit